MLWIVPRRRPRSSSPRQPSNTGIILIGIFKLLKALSLVAVGIGALKFLHKDLAGAITQWVTILRVDPDNRFIHPLISKAFSVTPKQLEALSVGTFVYAALLFTEGVGLLLRKRWAEYFTIITTAGLIPLEVYELAKHLSIAKIVVLAVNAAIVWYLVRRVRSPEARR